MISGILRKYISSLSHDGALQIILDVFPTEQKMERKTDKRSN